VSFLVMLLDQLLPLVMFVSKCYVNTSFFSINCIQAQPSQPSKLALGDHQVSQSPPVQPVISGVLDQDNVPLYIIYTLPPQPAQPPQALSAVIVLAFHQSSPLASIVVEEKVRSPAISIIRQPQPAQPPQAVLLPQERPQPPQPAPVVPIMAFFHAIEDIVNSVALTHAQVQSAVDHAPPSPQLSDPAQPPQILATYCRCFIESAPAVEFVDHQALSVSAAQPAQPFQAKLNVQSVKSASPSIFMCTIQLVGVTVHVFHHH